MGQIQWGNVAEWVGGVGTGVALLFTGWSVVHATQTARDAQDDRAWDEASAVTVTTKADPQTFKTLVTTTVTNNGKRPIHSVHLRFRRGNRSTPNDLAHTKTFHTIPPGYPQSWELPVDPAVWHRSGLEVGSLAELAFTDNNGLRWELRPNHILRQIPKPRWWRHLHKPYWWTRKGTKSS
jgi:hypothetical protein